MTSNENYMQELTDYFENAKVNYVKFSGKKTSKAATETRKALLSMKKVSDKMRKEILSQSKANKTERKSNKKPKVEPAADIEDIELPLELPKLVKTKKSKKK